MSTNENQNIFEAAAKDIINADISEEDKAQFTKNLLKLKEQKINLMITGCTGCGKSSTINALFDINRDKSFAMHEIAKIGTGVNPETMDIRKYELDNLILWDSPGLGDGKAADEKHRKNIINKLNEKDEKGNLLIDLVLVIVDGSNRDMGTSYTLINDVIIPNLGRNPKGRILVAINKADAAMNGRNWDYENHRPMPALEKFLNEKAVSVETRLKEGTNVDVEPICYSAWYKEEGQEQEPSYNLSKLLYYIIKFTPKEKRLAYINNISQNSENFKSNDGKSDYGKHTMSTFGEAFTDCISDGVDIGEDIGRIFGAPGKAVGKVIGGVVGAVGGVFSGICDTIKYGCYITTAVCEEYGKPDDCYELTAFRGFRDNWLRYQLDGEELIQLYYKTAPGIVEKINSRSDRADIYHHLNDEYLSKCLAFIEQGDNEKCKEKYTNMMYYLFDEEKKWQ